MRMAFALRAKQKSQAGEARSAARSAGKEDLLALQCPLSKAKRT